MSIKNEMTNGEFEVNLWGDLYKIRANWPDASSQIESYNFEDDEWGPTGMQSADFCHSHIDAMRHYLEKIVEAGGDDPEVAEIADEIEDALSGE